jgi:CheY-like chemotaxis protein
LQQMIWNLLTNAIKFTPEGGRVEVTTEHVRDRLKISVADTGIGISPEFLPFVFDRFRQQDGTSTRQHEGLGLGLAIVRQLAELHGGDVSAQSDGENKGSTFTISLPIIQTDSTVESPSEVIETNGKPLAVDPLKDVLIHVVDDDVDSCGLLEYAFSLRGAKVRISNSAADAYRKIAEELPDILLADINMPGEDGYSLIRKVRELTAQKGVELPAIALTAMARVEDADRAVAAGFNIHVPKPVEIDELTSTIQHMIQNGKKTAAV